MWFLYVIFFGMGSLIGYAIKCTFDRIDIEKYVSAHTREFDKITGYDGTKDRQSDKKGQSKT